MWKVSKHGVISDPYFPVFRPEITPYLDTFHAVLIAHNMLLNYLNLIIDFIKKLLTGVLQLFLKIHKFPRNTSVVEVQQIYVFNKCGWIRLLVQVLLFAFSEANTQRCSKEKLFCNFIEITLLHGCSPVNLLHIFRTPFIKNTSGRLLLHFILPEKYPSSLVA